MIIKKHLTVLAFITLAGTLPGAVLTNFTDPTWGSDFSSGTGGYTYGATDGVGGSGAIVTTGVNAGQNLTYDSSTFDLATVGSTIEATIDFRLTASANTVSDSNPTARVGLSDVDTGTFRAFGDFDVTSINTGAGTASGRLDSSGAGDGEFAGTFSINLDTWYTLFYSFETTGGSDGSLNGTTTAQLFEFGTTTLVDANATVTYAISGVELGNGTYVLTRGDQVANTAETYLDNLTAVVPEPSTYAMIAGALALCLVMIRRR